MILILKKYFLPSILLACLSLCCNCYAIAQTALNIKVGDKSENYIQAATVSIIYNGNSIVTEQTDELGKIALVIPDSILGKPIQIMASVDGYEKKIVSYYDNKNEIIISLDLDENTLDQVVITGLGKPSLQTKAVSIYKIINSDEIRNQGAVTLNDALRNQLGLNIGNDPMLGSSITMRGLSGNNIKILIDGLPVNGRENGNIDLSQFNLSNIDHIEIVQGPMSIMYGSDALGGVVNLITKKEDKKLYTGINTFYESIGKYNLGVENSMSIGKSRYYINLTRNFFQGWDPDDKDKRNPLWRPKEQYVGNVKYTYRFNERASITYGLDYSYEKLIIKGGTAGYSYYNRDTVDQYFYTKRFINRLQGNWQTGKNGYWETNNSYAIYNRERGEYITDLSTLDQKRSSASGSQSKVEFNDITSRTTFNNKIGASYYTLGYDINIEKANGVEKLSSDAKMIGDYAFFAIAEWNISKELMLQPAFRVTYNNAYKAPFIPSISFLYKPTDRCSVRGSYARGFRTPSLKELYLNFKDNNHDITGNENLKAEQSNHVQLSTAYDLYKQNKHHGIISLTGYYDDVTNQIALATVNDSNITSGVPPYTYVNIGRTKFLALMLQGNFDLKNIALKTGFSYNQSFATLTSPAFNYIEANASITYTIPGWDAGIAAFYKYTGSQPLLGSDIMGNSFFGSKANDYHNIDASLNKSFWKKRIVVTAGVRNITNNIILNYAGANSGGAHSNASGGMALTPGRSYFAALNLQIGE